MLKICQHAPIGPFVVLVAYCSCFIADRVKEGEIMVSLVTQVGVVREGFQLSMDMLRYLAEIFLDRHRIRKDRRIQALKNISPARLQSETPSVVDNSSA